MDYLLPIIYNLITLLNTFLFRGKRRGIKMLCLTEVPTAIHSIHSLYLCIPKRNTIWRHTLFILFSRLWSHYKQHECICLKNSVDKLPSMIIGIQLLTWREGEEEERINTTSSYPFHSVHYLQISDSMHLHVNMAYSINEYAWLMKNYVPEKSCNGRSPPHPMSNAKPMS